MYRNIYYVNFAIAIAKKGFIYNFMNDIKAPRILLGQTLMNIKLCLISAESRSNFQNSMENATI